jgi:hypothetical protein
VNKMSSLALLGAFTVAWAFAPLSWKAGSERDQHLGGDTIPQVVVVASDRKQTGDAEPAEHSQDARPETTAILPPSRSIREDVSASSSSYTDRQPLRLVHDLQRELKRVGCYAHNIDGEWMPWTRKAMKDFSDRVNAVLPVERPDVTQLKLLQSHSEIVCSEAACRVGESRVDNRCIPRTYVVAESKKPATTAGPQITWTKSYVTPARPEPDAARSEPDPAAVAVPSVVARRADTAPRPRRHTSRPSSGGSFLFGIFRW